MIRQTITIQISAIINNLSADLLIRQIFFREMLETSQFAKIYPRQSFPPYGSYKDIHYKDGFVGKLMVLIELETTTRNQAAFGQSIIHKCKKSSTKLFS